MVFLRSMPPAIQLTDQEITIERCPLMILKPGDRLSIKMLSYEYRDYHYKCKTVSQSPYIYNGIPYAQKDSVSIETGSWHATCLVRETVEGVHVKDGNKTVPATSWWIGVLARNFKHSSLPHQLLPWLEVHSPADIWRNNNVSITSKRRHSVVLT